MVTNNNDNINGFLDGYKARNLAILENNLFYDIKDLEKIIYLLSELTKDDPTFSKEHNNLNKIESKFKNTSIDILSRLIEFGIELSSFIGLASANFKRQYANRIKEIAIRYLDVCEKSNNKELLKRALDVASKVKLIKMKMN
jgi:hypothetical protein